ncbi:MAG: HEAT repeat domain-containing protein [Anaerolineae bacterium]|nr:HEAT repeat domain-containing protein [Anaerolineae bacterium]
MGHVFISYDSEDGDFVLDVTRQLEDAGFRVWSQHARLRAEGKWRESTDDAIREAFALLVIMTPKVRESEQVSYEWTFGLGVGTTVIPLMRQKTKLPLRLDSLQSLDFTDETGRPWGKLIRRVQEAFDQGQTQNRERDERRLPFPPRPSRDRPSSFLDRRSSAPRSRFDRISGQDDWREELDRASRDNDIPKLLAALEDANPDKRAHAANHLGEIGAKEAISALIACLRDDDYRVREDAARALGKLKAAGAVPELLEAVRQSRPGPFGGSGRGQNYYIDALREIGMLAVPVLVDALSDEDPRMRLQIVDLLGEIGEADAASALAGALRDPEWRVRWRAADALGKLGDPSAVPDLLDLLTDSSKDVRASAAWALGRIKHPSAVEGLIKLLHDREWRVRWGAAEALWEIGEPAVPPLIELLREEDDYVRRAAMRALAQIGTPAIDSLITMLSDTNWDVRWAAAGALHEIGDPAVKALVKALEAESWQATWAAAETLKRIGTKEAMCAVDRWREGRDSDAPQGEEAPFGAPAKSTSGTLADSVSDAASDSVSNAVADESSETDVPNDNEE